MVQMAGGPSSKGSAWGLNQPDPGFAERCREACRNLFEKIGYWAGGESFAYKQLSKYGDALSGLQGKVNNDVLQDLKEHGSKLQAYKNAFDGAATTFQALRDVTGGVLKDAADKFENTPTQVVKQAEDKIASFFRFDARVCDLKTGKLHDGVDAGILLKNAHKFGLSREDVKQILSIRAEIGRECDSQYAKLHQSFKESTGFLKPLTDLVESDKKFFNDPAWGTRARDKNVGPDAVRKIKGSYELARTQIVDTELNPLIASLKAEGKESEIGKAVTAAAAKLKDAQDAALETVKLCETISKAEKTTAQFLESVGLKPGATGPVEYQEKSQPPRRAIFSPEISVKLRWAAEGVTTSALMDCRNAKAEFCKGSGSAADLKSSIEKLDKSREGVRELLTQVTNALDQFSQMSSDPGHEGKTIAQREMENFKDNTARESAEDLYRSLKQQAEAKAADAFELIGKGGLEGVVQGLRSAALRTDLFESALFGITTTPSKATDIRYICDKLADGLGGFEASCAARHYDKPILLEILQEESEAIAENFEAALVAENKKPEAERFSDPDAVVENLGNYDALLEKAAQVSTTLETYPLDRWNALGREVWDIS